MGANTEFLTDRFNDSESAIQPEYKRYLRPVFSPDMKFSSLSSNTSIVAANLVALDSELPLKSRGKFSTADGEVPKIGMKKFLNESQLQAIQNMIARGGFEDQVVQRLFSDMNDSVAGVYERLDFMFYQALSTGRVLIEDSENVGTGIEADFGIPASNKLGVQLPWTESAANPIEDIENAISAARAQGVSPRYVFMDKATFSAFKNNESVKNAFAGSQRVDPSFLFRVSTEEISAYLLTEFNITAIIVDKLIASEIGGQKIAVEPWSKGAVVFTTTLDLGSLTYSQLAEATSRVPGVQYGTVDSFILTSMFRKNDPLREYNSVQALAITVLSGVDSIFHIDTNEAETASVDVQTEDDANYLYQAVLYTKQSVVDGINAARAVDDYVNAATINQLDATLAKKIDQLSEEGTVLFEAELTAA